MGRARIVCKLCSKKIPVGERRIHLLGQHSDEVMPKENWLRKRALPIIAEAMKKNPNLLRPSELFEMIQMNFDFDLSRL